MDASYLVARRHAGLAIVASGLVFTCDSSGNEEGHNDVVEVEHGC